MTLLTEDTAVATHGRNLDDRVVYLALAAVAGLTPAFTVGLHLAFDGAPLALLLWTSFLLANLVVWPAVLTAGLVQSVRRGMRTARVLRRGLDRRLAERRTAAATATPAALPEPA